MVRLKEPKAVIEKQALDDFNSTMVRLKVLQAKGYVRGIILFQFHYGTIKRLPRLSLREKEIHFNSTMVRLKVFGKE